MNNLTFLQAPATTRSIRVGVFDVHTKAPFVGACVSVWHPKQAKNKRLQSGTKQTRTKYTPSSSEFVAFKSTQPTGWVDFEVPAQGSYWIMLHHLAKDETHYVEGAAPQDVSRNQSEVTFNVKLISNVARKSFREDGSLVEDPRVGDTFVTQIQVNDSDRLKAEDLIKLLPPEGTELNDDNLSYRGQYIIDGLDEKHPIVRLPYRRIYTEANIPEKQDPARVDIDDKRMVFRRTAQPLSGNVGVTLSRTTTASTDDLSFWQGILNSTEQMSFNTYLRFMNKLFCGEKDPKDLPDFELHRFKEKESTFHKELLPNRLLPFTDSDAYRVVKAATEAFVMVNCGVLAPRALRPFDDTRDADYLRRRDLPVPTGGFGNMFERYLEPIVDRDGTGMIDKTLPYLAVIRAKLPDIAIKLSPLDDFSGLVRECTGILRDKLTNPCLLELIWSYWHEEGMLVQTMNSITRRFQNVRSGERDPLANLEIDPLRPLNNVLWGFVQDEQHRLSIVRRNYEYDHHYGLRLEGKAVQRMQAADSRSRFLEAFHNLLRLCNVFFKQDDDTTVKADAFPVLNALKEVHLILSQGAHNQFGDLPSTARIEMLMQQWMLARPEFREFLPTRIMTAYPEPWMDRVDAMKKLQGWTDASVLHFRNLAIFGEQVLLSIRWGHWSDVQEPLQAFNWARFFRPQIQGYSHAYRAVTGADLAVDSSDAKVDATLPSVLLQRRLATQQRTA